MNWEILEIDKKEVEGLPVLLTKSQTENQRIISNHWEKVNSMFNTIKRRIDHNWEKYGLTFKKNNSYFYMPSVPIIDSVNLKQYVIPKNKYVKFVHCGDMNKLKFTYFDIYKDILPKNSFKLNLDRPMVHYERYDNRFNWNSSKSEIDIFIPIN
ncbi:MAG: GyrI-like domain-containing protein [Spirochaetaceae bacterium]